MPAVYLKQEHPMDWRTGMSKTAVIAIGAALLLVSVAAAAGVYRWVDAEGEVHYSDRPVQGAAPTQVKVPEAGDGAAVTESAETQSARAKQCELARKRLNEYEISDALFQEDEFGRRREISGEERVQLIVRAQANVQAFCGEEAAVAEVSTPPAAPTGPAPEAAAEEPAPPQPAAAASY
jgi:hypothetical protein